MIRRDATSASRRRAVLTGAGGMLGRHVVARLARDPALWAMTAFVRPETTAPVRDWLTAHGVDLIEASLLDAHQMAARTPDDTDVVLHLAADTSTDPRDRARQWQTNVEGTRAVAEAVLLTRVRRLVHVSSASVYGFDRHRIDEHAPQVGSDHPVAYVASKAAAEEVVRAAIARGLDAVILNPGHMLGAYDLNNWAMMIRLAAAGRLPALPPGGGSFAAAAAVANAVVAAIDRAMIGENYLLGGPVASFRELIGRSAAILDRPLTSRVAPAWALIAAARLIERLARLTGSRPSITVDAAIVSCHSVAIDSDRARRDLGYAPAALDDMLRETIDWLILAGLIDASPRPAISG
ncbi:NAD-dependent epimerase/dehydratase family protein [Tistrella sp. BH-R2-4]|uniref:NAD-dependent epimerase/dehydratase family protein n=1 Tax=Tistrella arctica TaxID=3133430 RepID=A0ABU9YDN7_9PROT